MKVKVFFGVCHLFFDLFLLSLPLLFAVNRPLVLVYIGVKAKVTSLPDGFIENPFNVHIEQRQKTTKRKHFCVHISLSVNEP